jgi:hypothetical protein
MGHTFFENTRVTPLINAAGTIINATADGTAQGTVSVFDYEYHAFVYAGSIANTGTVFLYAIGASQTNAVLGSFILGSINGNNFVWEVKADAFGAQAGTLFTHLGALVKVDSGGTWRGAAAWYSHQPRSAGTTPLALGWGSVGTSLY